jgi:hypothetical protein
VNPAADQHMPLPVEERPAIQPFCASAHRCRPVGSSVRLAVDSCGSVMVTWVAQPWRHLYLTIV